MIVTTWREREGEGLLRYYDSWSQKRSFLVGILSINTTTYLLPTVRAGTVRYGDDEKRVSSSETCINHNAAKLRGLMSGSSWDVSYTVGN